MRTVLCLCLLKLVSCVPTDLSCTGVEVRPSVHLHDCEFVQASNTDIACWLYSASYHNSSVQPVKFVIRFRTVFYLKEKVLVQFNDTLGPQWWWCLGIRSSILDRVDDVPKNASNIFKFPEVAATLMNVMKDAVAFVEFQGQAAAGFALIRDDCDLSSIPVNKSCISALKGSSYVITPGPTDISPLDIILGRVLKLYFQTMQGVMRSMTLSSNLSGYLSSLWLNQLQYVNIEKLNASNNNFNDNNGVLPVRFHNLTKLNTLYMRNCQLRDFEQANWKETPNLEHLDLSDNMFTSPPSGIQYLTKLWSLNIGVDRTKSAISTFTLRDELQSLKYLSDLTLSGLPLGQISRKHLPKHLQYLDVSNCDLTTLAPDTFSDLPDLQTIILTSNKLRTLPPLVFKSIRSGYIILKDNELRTGQGLVLNSINLLDLSYNRMQDPKNLVSQGRIGNLDLSQNEIANWTSPFLFNSDNYSVLNINLSYNNILIINHDMIPSLNYRIESIDLGGNLINCQDCSLKSTKYWLNSTNTTVYINGVVDSLQCYLPITDRFKPVENAYYNITACETLPVNILLVAVLPCSIVFSIVSVTVILIYSYRFEILYIKHLYRVRRRNESVTERDGCKYDVFVSYCGKDRDWVMDVMLPALENPRDRYVLCLHERDFVLGTYIMDNIVSCIEHSRRVVLVLTNNYIKSQWCQWELQMAQHRIFEDCKDFLVLLELDHVHRDHVPMHLRTLMATRTYLEWPGENLSVANLTSFWSRLKDALGTSLAITNLIDGVEDHKIIDDSDLDSDDDLLHYQHPNHYFS